MTLSIKTKWISNTNDSFVGTNYPLPFFLEICGWHTVVGLGIEQFNTLFKKKQSKQKGLNSSLVKNASGLALGRCVGGSRKKELLKWLNIWGSMGISRRPWEVQLDCFLITFLRSSERVFRIKEQFEEQGRMNKNTKFPRSWWSTA